MKCPLCEKFYNEYPLIDGKHKLGEHIYSSPVICAFDNPEQSFNGDNWGCETMSCLRTIVKGVNDEGHLYFMRDDMCNGSIGVIPLPSDELGTGYLVMNWYKNRGRTDKANIINEDDPIKRLSLETALLILREYGVIQ